MTKITLKLTTKHCHVHETNGTGLSGKVVTTDCTGYRLWTIVSILTTLELFREGKINTTVVIEELQLPLRIEVILYLVVEVFYK